MSDRRAEREQCEQLSRRALRKALEGAEPELSHVQAAMAGIQADARSLRSLGSANVGSLLVPLARRAVPRLAAVAALLVLISGVLYFAGRTGSTRTDTFTTLLLGGDAVQEDALVQAVLDPESNP